MGALLNDLDLEFEDEESTQEENQAKKTGIVDAEEIGFNLLEGGADLAASQVGEKTVERAINEIVSNPAEAESERKEEVKSNNKSDYKFGEELKRVGNQNPLLQAEYEASLKIKVLEKSTEFLLKNAQAAKILELQVNDIINRIHKKVPGLKPELVRLKKILSDYSEESKKVKVD